MRFFIALNFVLLAACLARSQAQDALNPRAEIQARADAPPTTPAKATDTTAKSTTGASASQLPAIKDPKLCAMIVKEMKETEAKSKNAGRPVPKTGEKTPPSGTSSSPKPSASGVKRRSKLAKRADISLNRRDSAGTKEAPASAAADANACKEMETMIKASREKMQADLKKAIPPPKQDGAKKESTPKSSSTDATPKTSPTDAKPNKGAAEPKPKTGTTDPTPKTGSTDAKPTKGSTDAKPTTGAPDAMPKTDSPEA